jgi:serine/threonine protein kinase
MTDGPQGHGWWQASDLKWYPPEQRPDYMAALPPPPTADAAQQQPADSTRAATPTSQQPQKPAKTRQVIERDKLGPLSKIGQGGQGVVYGAPNVKTKFAASMVYKEYKAAALAEIDFTALAAMPALVEESLTYTQAERLISFAAWPCAIIEDAGTPTGFVMPAIPEEFFISLTTAKGVSPSTAEFQHLLNHPSVLAARGITLDDAQRFTLLRETASALTFLHKHGVCVGDISPKNLLFSLIPQEGVYSIDCDAMRINTVSALPQVETPGWDAPAGEELATIYSDTYKLGLLALRLLSGDQDTKNPQHLPGTTPAQLRQIVTDTLTNPPHQRPLPEAWTSVLGHAIEHAQHKKKTAVPVGAPLAAPEIPVVHSRPPAHSAPPVRPSAPPPRPADRPPPQIGTPPPPWGHRPRRQPKLAGVAGVAALIVIMATAGITFKLLQPHSAPTQTPTAQPAAPSGPTGQPAPASGQTVLPFTGLNRPDGVAVDTTGNLYVTDSKNNRVVELAAGSATQAVLPFTGLNHPDGVAVDTAGNLYVTDSANNRVVKLPAGSSTPAVLPFTGLNDPEGVAVDAAGNLYVVDSKGYGQLGNARVLKLPVGSSAQEVLLGEGALVGGAFSSLSGPVGVAVDAAGDLYVADSNNNRVVKLTAG